MTIKGICDAAAVHAGSFYNLFESKEQVVLTAVRDAIDTVDDLLLYCSPLIGSWTAPFDEPFLDKSCHVNQPCVLR